MKKKEKKDLFSKSYNELKVVSEKNRDEIAKMGIEMLSGKIKNVSLIREKKRDLARILTVLRRKELEK